MGRPGECKPRSPSGGSGEQLTEPRITRQVSAQDECVDKEPDQALQLGLRTPRDRRTNGDILLRGVAVQEYLERRQQRDVQRRPSPRPSARSASRVAFDNIAVRSPPRWLATIGLGLSVGSSS